jgi:translation elongation factor EF-1alpha
MLIDDEQQQLSAPLGKLIKSLSKLTLSLACFRSLSVALIKIDRVEYNFNQFCQLSQMCNARELIKSIEYTLSIWNANERSLSRLYGE